MLDAIIVAWNNHRRAWWDEYLNATQQADRQTLWNEHGKPWWENQYWQKPEKDRPNFITAYRQTIWNTFWQDCNDQTRQNFRQRASSFWDLFSSSRFGVSEKAFNQLLNAEPRNFFDAALNADDKLFSDIWGNRQREQILERIARNASPRMVAAIANTMATENRNRFLSDIAHQIREVGVNSTRFSWKEFTQIADYAIPRGQKFQDWYQQGKYKQQRLRPIQTISPFPIQNIISHILKRCSNQFTDSSESATFSCDENYRHGDEGVRPNRPAYDLTAQTPTPKVY